MNSIRRLWIYFGARKGESATVKFATRKICLGVFVTRKVGGKQV